MVGCYEKVGRWRGHNLSCLLPLSFTSAAESMTLTVVISPTSPQVRLLHAGGCFLSTVAPSASCQLPAASCQRHTMHSGFCFVSLAYAMNVDQQSLPKSGVVTVLATWKVEVRRTGT